MSGSTLALSVIGGDGADVLTGGLGADILDGGAGNDILSFDNVDILSFSTLKIDGGSGGNDTYQMTGSGESLDLTSVNNAVIKGVERIDITGSGDNVVTMDLSDVLDISTTTDTLYVDGDSGDSVIDPSQGWTFQGTAGGYYHYTDAAATLYVDMDISTITLT